MKNDSIITGAVVGPFLITFIVAGLLWLTNGWIAVIWAALVAGVIAISLLIQIGVAAWSAGTWIVQKVSA